MKIRKKVILFLIPILIISCFAFIDFNKNINISIEYKKYATPANPAFADDNFYKCVIDAYNSKFVFLDYVPKLTYDDIITDEQLQQITGLDCSSIWRHTDKDGYIIHKSYRTKEDGSGYSYQELLENGLLIGDTAGIEKMVNLTSVSFSYDLFNTIDLSNNLVLEKIYLGNIELENINLNDNINLKELILHNNNLSNINLDSNKNLEYVSIVGNNLTNIDVSNNVSLKTLHLGSCTNCNVGDFDGKGNNITEIDLSKNVNLTLLDLSNNGLESIDLTNNTLLKTVSLNSNKLSSIKFGENSQLINLYASNNNLKIIDLGGLTTLENLYLHSNNFESINLNDNINLKKVGLDSNKLVSIDLGKNDQLMEISISENLLDNIDLSSNVNLEYVDLSNNKFTSFDFSNNKNLNINKSRINQNKNFYYFVGDTYATDNDEILNCFKSHNNNITINGNSIRFNDIAKHGGWYISDGSYISPSGEEKEFESLYTFFVIGLERQNKNYLISHRDLYVYTHTDNNNDAILKNVYISFSDIKSGIIKDGKYIIDVHGIYKEYDILNISSDVYDFNSKYIFDTPVNVKRNIDLGNVNFNNCDYELDYNNGYLNIVKDEGNVDYYYLVNYKINKYAYNDKYILVDDSDISSIIKNIDCNHCVVRVNDGYNNLSEGEINDNYKLVLKVNSINADNFKQYDIINIDSKYNINYDESYIYVGTDIDSSIILSNINLSEIASVNGILKDNKYIVMANNEVIKEFNIVNYTSDKYDLSNDFIQVNDNDISSFINNFECTNCNVKVYDGNNYLDSGKFGENYKLVFMHEDEVLKEYDLKYPVMGLDIIVDNLKLNLGNNNVFKLSADIYPSFVDDKTIFWTSSDINVATVDSEGVVTAKSIGSAVITATSIDGVTDICRVEVSDTVLYNVTYEDGVNTYIEQYEEGENVVFKSDLNKLGYKLIGWNYSGKNYELTDNLVMPGNDIVLVARWNLIIPEVKNYEVNNNNMNGISLNTDINNIDLGIDDIYDVKVYNHDNKSKLSGLIGTGDKVKIYLDSTLVSEYDVIIKGDLTGDGETKIGDIAKLYQYFKNVISMDECYIKAGNVVDSDDIIKIGDVAKLYQFMKGKINL